MPAQLLSGKALSEQIQDNLKQRISEKMLQGYRAPQLAVILLGENMASQIYVQHKIKACERTGIISVLYLLPENTPENKLLDLIEKLNQDSKTDAILVQMPLPAHLSKEKIKEKIIEKIDPQKDADGFHPYNLGKLAQGDPLLRSCTAYGIIRLLQHYHLPIKSQHAVVVGASTIVGRPLCLELLNAGATVTICHSKTQFLQGHIQQAQILISATGRKNIISPDWIQPGAVIIDVGIHREESQTISGDLDFKKIMQKAAFVTPVPGGVGPMTVAMLLENTFQIYQGRHTV